jgi:hypothetical protein
MANLVSNYKLNTGGEGQTQSRNASTRCGVHAHDPRYLGGSKPAGAKLMWDMI